MDELVFDGPDGPLDLGIYIRRARALEADGAIRLQCRGRTLAAYVGVLPGHGLMRTGAVIGLRVMALAEPFRPEVELDAEMEAELDVTVSLASVAERIARSGTSILPIPPTSVRVAWAAMSPPRSGWEVVGDVRVADLQADARDGIAQIALGVSEGSGSDAVTALRQRVWARDSRTTPPIPAGAAFAGYALGFLTGESARVFAHGRWTRLSTPTGHVLVC
jgi:hypothetical protein